MIVGFIALRMRDFAFFSFCWYRARPRKRNAAVGGGYQHYMLERHASTTRCCRADG
jgi:hypothetical protein